VDLSVINTLAATVAENEAIGRKAGKAIALGVGAGLGTVGPGIGVGYGFALTEAIVFYAFIFGLIAFFLS
jgi:F-type H+-transporting ATPase subunit c